MKKQLLPIIVLLFACASLLSAQTTVNFNIHHKLGNNAFEMNAATSNNLGNEFDFTRLEYYIAEISLVHDGGQETAINDLYLLVKANEEVAVDLGEHSISELEAIRFHIGVDEANNHADPASFASSHPLAPQNPSMHWGWAAGYRFLAFEGRSGTNMGQVWQIHALEDENYLQTEVILELSSVNDVLDIHLDANYARVLESIDLTQGPIVHGGYDEAATALANFQSYVFTPTGDVTSTVNFEEIHAVNVYPNPASAKNGASFFITATTDEQYSLSIADVSGKQIKYFPLVQGNTELRLGIEQPGLYFLSLQKEGQNIITKKLVVQ